MALARPRVGHIEFLNCLPLYYGLVHSHAVVDLDLRRGTPAELSDALIAGELDIAPVPSIEYLRHADDLLLLPELTVSSTGEVGSIILAVKEPVEDAHGKRIAMTDRSRTSQALLRILLIEHWGVEAELVVCPPDLKSMLASNDGALLIGDDALRADYPASVLTYDLGSAWEAHTGLPMVYAVWAVRRAYAEVHPGIVSRVHQGFMASLDYSRDNADEVAERAAEWEPFDAGFLAAYFRKLSFSFDDADRRGLELFAGKAVAHGLLGRAPQLHFAL
ncbi:MAG TPA: menaquinone biosynthesis protein [Egibacteraceae bacterium]|nr:menaquinone biosynthesis protein [Egibacteraceae bacterium]